jgi:hypothetical protein
MLEYVFFESSIREKFVSFLVDREVPHQLKDDDGLLVDVSEDIDDATGDAIDEYFEILLQETAELMEQGEDALEKNVAGVLVALADGAVCTVRLDPDLVGRVLGCISMAEFRDMVQEVARWVELKDNSPLCHVVGVDINEKI